MKFSDIPGHSEVKQRLRHLVDSRKVPHSLLLEGPEGSAKFALARAFTQYLHCQNKTPQGDSCGVCPACVQHQTFNHIDTFFSFPIVKRGSNKITISDDYLDIFREFISENPFMDFSLWLEALDHPSSQPSIYVDEGSELLRKLNFKAKVSEYKVVLIWQPERMRAETANKLLKLIEEPHADTIFIMTSAKPNEILPTIYSRTQRISVKRLSDNEIQDFLSNRGISPEYASSIAKMADGNLNSALRLSSKENESSSFLALFADLMRRGFKRDLPALRKWANEMGAKNREQQIEFVDYCAYLFRENLLLNTSAGKYISTMTREEANFSERFHPFVNSRNVLGLFNAMNDAKRDIAANGNGKIIFFDIALKVLMLIKK